MKKTGKEYTKKLLREDMNIKDALPQPGDELVYGGTIGIEPTPKSTYDNLTMRPKNKQKMSKVSQTRYESVQHPALTKPSYLLK